MPLYEYHCDRCGRNFEVIQKFSDDPLTLHNECGGNVERLISAPALQFKGTGWYVTDYARKGSQAGGSNGKSEAKGDSKAESKSDTKSETTAKSESTGKTASTKGESKTT